MSFFDTPRTRRLKSDLEAIQALKEDSTILDFQAMGDSQDRFLVTFKGRGLLRKSEVDPVEAAGVHRVEIRLGIDYPRSRPDLQWLTSIYHPNISAVGAVCLGGYSTNWVPSLGLAELCEMLWDMIRYANYDPKSAYNYAAGRWSETQTQFDFPLDPRPIRDRRVKMTGDNVIKFKEPPREAAPPIAGPPAEDILVIDDTPPAPPPRGPAKGADDDILIIE